MIPSGSPALDAGIFAEFCRLIAKPIAWPPTTLEEVRPLVKKLTEDRDGKLTFTVLVTTEKGEFPVYVGPPGETRLERSADQFLVRLGDKVIYRVSRAARLTGTAAGPGIVAGWPRSRRTGTRWPWPGWRWAWPRWPRRSRGA